MLDTRPLLLASDFPQVRRKKTKTLQVNLGYYCNMSCAHCHVDAGPHRREMMSFQTAEETLSVLRAGQFEMIDLTGGAPELNPHFRHIVTEARGRVSEIIDRCNLTVLLEPEQHDLPGFLAEQQVTVIASLPCYEEKNVAGQRGKEAYAQSIDALSLLNAQGYGSDPALKLHLVYNPVGPYLPPDQQSLENDYKHELKARWGIVFNDLYTLTNMPIKRFGGTLLAKGQFDTYIRLLKDNYREKNLDRLMCRDLVSVNWQGYLYDCDFNQMLDWPLCAEEGIDDEQIAPKRRLHVRDLVNMNLAERKIMVGEHCYGCAAGSGSSCGGALV